MAAATAARIAQGAWRLARHATGIDDDDQAKAGLLSILADARGLPMKVAQFISQGDADLFAQTANAVPVKSLEHMMQGLGDVERRHLRAAVDLAEAQVGASASLGQVHRGEHRHRSQSLAVKLQYPGIRVGVEKQLRLLGLLPSVGPVRRYGIDLQGYREVLRQNIDRELDYGQEAAAQIRYREQIAGRVPGLRVPQVLLDLSGPTVLVQEFIETQPFAAAHGSPTAVGNRAAVSKADRRRLGEILLRSFFVSLFQVGLVHADPHPGNFGLSRGPSQELELCLFDYGCTVEVDAESRLALLRLIIESRAETSGVEGEQRGISALACFSAVGFDSEKLAPIAGLLPVVARSIFRPFCGDMAFRVQNYRLAERLENVLGDLRWWFRAAGPPDLTYLMRAFHGVLQHLQALDVELCWYRILRDCLSPGVWAAAQAYEPADVRWADGEPMRGTRFAELPATIHVRLSQGGAQKVKVALPSRAIDALVDMIPDDIRAELAAEKFDFGAAIRAALTQTEAGKDGRRPILERTDNDGRRCQIWLE